MAQCNTMPPLLRSHVRTTSLALIIKIIINFLCSSITNLGCLWSFLLFLSLNTMKHSSGKFDSFMRMLQMNPPLIKDGASEVF